MPKIFNRAIMVLGEVYKVGTPTITVVALDKDGMVSQAYGATTPTDADKGYAKGCIFTNTAGGVGTSVYINEGSATSADFNIINGTGSAGAVTLDQLFLLDQALDILAGSVLTIDRSVSTATGVLLLTNSGGGSGNVLQITNVGTGKDIRGSSGTWDISKLGAVTALSVVLAGNAGADSLTLTLGDITLAAGGITITKAANNATLSVTNNTATSASVIVVAGSGVFTGSTTTSFMTITPSGLTTGTAVYLAVLGLTTGKGIHVNYAGTTSATSGVLLHLSSTATAMTSTGRMFLSDHTGVTGTSTVLNEFKTAANDETVLLGLTAASLTTGIVVDFGTLAALTTGIGIKMAHTTSVIADGGSLIQLSSSSTDTGGATNGVMIDVLNSGMVAGTLVKIRASNASQTTTTALSIVQSGVSTGFTGSLVSVTGASTTGAGNLLLVTGVNTTAGDVVKLVNNAITLGAATILNVAHTTSVLGAGSSLVRISSTGIDTGTTTGTLLDLSQTAAVGNVAVKLTDSSADATARTLLSIVISSAAAAGAIPISVTNAGVQSTNYRRILKETATGITLWWGNGTTANGNLSGTAGDVLLNGGSNKPEYCTGTTVWVALV